MDNSNKYGTLERQKELLGMLKQVDAFCCKYDISYSLCAGTLLGAVRHKGFIPWDDDVDLMVDRSNLNKFLKAFQDHPEETPYHLNRYLWVYRVQEVGDTTKGLLRPTIDIFVIDNCPDSNFKRKYKTFMIKMLQGMMKIELDYEGKSLFMKACMFCTHIMGKLFSEESLFRKYDRVSQIGNEGKSRFVAAYDYPFGYLNRRYNSNLMDNFEMHQFEDVALPITKEYDHYLTVQYGDYMTPPKEENRVSEHM